MIRQQSTYNPITYELIEYKLTDDEEESNIGMKVGDIARLHPDVIKSHPEIINRFFIILYEDYASVFDVKPLNTNLILHLHASSLINAYSLITT